MQSTELVGWASSIVLFVTITYQVFNQWRSGSSEGVSPLLFCGQIVASIGFTIYSAVLGNWVFLITNIGLVTSAVVGLWIQWRHRRAEGS